MANSGRFLLAQLYLESLQGKDTPWAIEDALSEMESATRTETAYSTAYTNAVERIQERTADWGRAKQVLGWITCAKRQLHEVELQHALAVGHGDLVLNHDKIPLAERLVSVCAGLVTVDKQSGIIRLVHYTAQDYFESENARWFPDIESIMTRVCTTYLSFDCFATSRCRVGQEFEERPVNHPMYDYAAQNWGLHAQANDAPEVLSFLSKPHQVRAASQRLPRYRPEFSNGRDHALVTALHLAAFFGLAWVVEIIGDCHIIDRQDEYGQTSLHLASRQGYHEVSKTLIEKGANANAAGSNRRTALHAASLQADPRVVKLLLENGANIDIPDNVGETPLHTATLFGHIEVVKLLLEKGANIDIPNDIGETPLHRASSYGLTKVVRLLLEKGANVDLPLIFKGTPLYTASSRGLTQIVRLLLEKGANINLPNISGETPLYGASFQGSAEVVRLLLEKGADVNLPDTCGETPLHAASIHGSAEVVRLLLENNAITNVVAVDGETPLYYACLAGHGEVAKQLIENGADITWVRDATDDSVKARLRDWLLAMGIQNSWAFTVLDRP